MLDMSESDQNIPKGTRGEPTISETISDNRNAPAASTSEVVRGGDREALVRVIEKCQSYLLLVAERALTPDVKAKEAASDLVQEALLEAQREPGRWTGRAEPELRAWLRRLLLNKIAHAARRYRGTGKRRIGREVPLTSVEDDSALAEALAADQTSPSGQAARHEEEAALRSALDRLPERMRQAVLWRHREDCSFDEIGRRLGCSNVAARKLWLRALQQLQVELKDSIDSGPESG